MAHALKRSFHRFLEHPQRGSAPKQMGKGPESSPVEYGPLQRLILTDDVSRTLFGEYADHRDSDRGDEETGWILLGLRQATEAIVLATLPAGAERHASDTHVRFNSAAQAFGSRVVRQGNKQLTLLGVVHTHPGSLRHPSDGDYRGDIVWVKHLRGGEGVFGIGTADNKQPASSTVATQPEPNRQSWGELNFSWYSLWEGDRNYRALPVEWTIGPDLALPLRPVWEEMENNAERLDRLAQQIRGVQFDVVQGKEKQAFLIDIPLAESERSIRVILEGKAIRYFLVEQGDPLLADLRDVCVDQGVYLLLAELAGK